MKLKPSVVIDIGLFGGAKVGRAECKDMSTVLVMAIELIVPSREAPDVFIFMPEVFIFQYWSIPKRGRKSDGGRLEKFIPEKSNELNDVGMLLSPPQVYNSDRDVDLF